MGSDVPESRPLPGGGSSQGAPRRGHYVTMVEFRGLLPAQPAGFLGRLSEKERRDVYALLGTFQEVRGLVGAGRLLHAALRDGPRAAARGRITIREFLTEKSEILRAIAQLHQKIHRVAQQVCFVLPRVPRLTP